MRRYNLALCVLALITVLLLPVTTKAETEEEQSAVQKYVSTEEFNKMLQKATGKNTDYTKGLKYFTNCDFNGKTFQIIGERSDIGTFDLKTQDEITIKYATAMAGVAVMDKNKTDFRKTFKGFYTWDEFPTWVDSKYVATIYYKRISDISKADQKLWYGISACYTKGLYVGKTNGTYTLDRKFNMNRRLTYTQAKSICYKIQHKTKRYKFSDDMQLTRKSRLPKNAKYYKFILASFPNSYYDTHACSTTAKPDVNMGHKTYVGYTPKEVYNNMHKYGRVGTKYTQSNRSKFGGWSWNDLGVYQEKGTEVMYTRDYVLQKAVDCVRLTCSYNYKNTRQWKKDLAFCYQTELGDDGGDFAKWNEAVTKTLNNLDTALRNKKIVLECKYAVADYNSLYYDPLGQAYLKVATRFRYKSGIANLSKDSYWLPTTYGEGGYVKPGKISKVKYGQWIDAVVDVPVVMNVATYMNGADCYIGMFRMWDLKSEAKLK